MGALTESRKRCFDNLYSSPHPISDLTATPSSKKSKVQFHPSIPNPQPPPALSYPPPAGPLSRPLHGPQRRPRAFNSNSLVKKGHFDMGNFVSSLFGFGSRREKLELDEYRNLVKDSRRARLGLGSVGEISPTDEVKVLDRRVEDARRVVGESVERREVGSWVRREPVYKELYEEAKRRDLKLNNLAFEVKLKEEQLSGLQFVRKAQEEKPGEKKPKEDLRELFSPLTDEEEAEVSNALWGGNRRQRLVAHESSNIEISRESLQCLNDGAWLNDEVINLYLELLKERERRDPNKFLRCHFFSTFFYKRLITGKNKYDFNAVRRWTSQRKLGYALIECDKIFVPIHQDVHWCLAVINVKDKIFQYLDSLGGMDTDVLKTLARYMIDEVKDKNKKQIDTTSWKQEMVVDRPLQRNGFDCGMFMLKYTDFYSRGLDLCFSQEHMSYFRKRTAKEILNLRVE